MLRQARLALANAQRIEGAFQVFPYRPGEFRLAAVGFDHGGIGLDPAKARSKVCASIPPASAC